MATFIGVMLVLGAIALFFTSLVALVRPIARIGLGSRKRAGGGVVASLVLFVVGVLVIPTEGPAPASSEAVAEEVVAEGEGGEAAKREPVLSVWSDEPIIRAWSFVYALGHYCETPLAQMVRTVVEAEAGEATVYAAYSASAGAARSCQEAADDIAEIETPKAAGLDQSVALCADAYRKRVSAIERVMSVIDGDDLPSQVEAARQAMVGADGARLECLSAFKMAAQQKGFDLPAAKLGPLR